MTSQAPLVVLLGLLLALVGCGPTKATVRVGSKNFTEQQLLGEMIAEALEADTSLTVERRFQLGGTQVAFEAIRSGDIDIYPEYTGTGIVSILKMPAPADGDAGSHLVDTEFRSRFGLAWLPGFGFENTYALAVREDDAETAHLRTVSDLVRTGEVSIAGTHEFMDREDGFAAFSKRYALVVPEGGAISLDPGLLYEAIAARQVRTIAAFSTDARVLRYHLRVLEDDKRFFPTYAAAPVVRVAVLQDHPTIRPLLDRLAGMVTRADMQSMNYDVDVGGEAVKDVVARFLVSRGVAQRQPFLVATLSTNRLGEYFWGNRAYVLGLVERHLGLTLAALFPAAIVGIGLGFLVARRERLAAFVFPVIGTFQTIPSLALLGFLVPLVGIGVRPALIALFLYALLPVARSTFAGIRGVDPRLCDVGRGIGLTSWQILTRIEVPIALPMILAGVRMSAVILVGSATLASLVGAGGLGDPIFRGLSSLKTPTILLGAVPAALLALALDRILGFIEQRVVSPGLRKRSE